MHHRHDRHTHTTGARLLFEHVRPTTSGKAAVATAGRWSV
ncbi:hypothetical protein JO379_000450 [Streptomyces syringium]|uniref:Uncharacterized protein n=1 Tax=Streptomyces syringium TaxID=76729 RepID=A0ABS4XWV1_9ACTN|nr:hypothetical protein [Streptomyces syringium]